MATYHFDKPNNISDHNLEYRLPKSIRAALDALPVATMILDKNYKVIFTSKFFKSFILPREGSSFGLNPGDTFRCIHRAQMHEGEYKGCQNCGSVIAAQETAKNSKISEKEVTAIDLGCVFRNFKVTSAPLVVDQYSFIAVTLQDISDQKRRRVLERVFFHDIMNIVGPLNSYSEILEGGGVSDNEKIIRRFKPLTIKLIDEINAQKQLLEAESGDLQANPKDYDLNENLNELAEFFKDHPLSREKDLVLYLEKESPHLQTDKALFDRVLINLIKNALEASRKGDKVSVGYKIHPDRVEVWVHNPTGMPEDIKKELFSKSVSTKGKGRGIGTYSIKLLMESYLFGEVDFTSDFKEGTKFSVSLPV